MTLDEYEAQIAILTRRAMGRNAARVWDAVDGALGVAIRHCQRIRDGYLDLTPAIAREIHQSLEQAKEILQQPDPERAQS